MKNLYRKFSMYIILCCLLFSTSVSAEVNESTHTISTDSNVVVAVLPFVNYSGNSEAMKMCMKNLYEQLDMHDVQYLSHTTLRPTLRKYRIRTVGSIGQEDVSDIKKSTNINRIILGALNICSERSNPEVSVSVRIIDANNMHIISAVTQSAKGFDSEKLFGLGKIKTIETLMQQVMQKLVANLLFETENIKNQKQPSYTIALIPLDNISKAKKAGLISANILLTTLVQHGYNVIEPGIIDEIMQKNKRVLRGEVDLQTLKQIKNLLHIDLLVTGSIEQFKISRGSRNAEIEIGLRTLDASNGKIISMFNDNKKGDDSETLFGLGKINAMGNLISKACNQYVHTLEKKSEKYFAKQN